MHLFNLILYSALSSSTEIGAAMVIETEPSDIKLNEN